MKERFEAADDPSPSQQELWLGYDGLLVPLPAISALLVYQPVWDRRIMQDYGRVPSDVQVVVLLYDGRVLPARRSLADLRSRWNEWQAGQLDPARDHGASAAPSTDED